MLRDGWLSDAELRPDDCDDLPRRLLFVEEQFEDPPADRVTSTSKAWHGGDRITSLLYTSTLIYIEARRCDLTLCAADRHCWHDH